MEPTSWQCPFCGNYATLRDSDVSESQNYLHSGTPDGSVFLRYCSIKCPSGNCFRVSLFVEYKACPDKFLDRSHNYGISQAKPIREWHLLPESGAKPQPDCIPKAIRDDYYEACLIKDKSPKASATLSRRCLQAMIRDFWKIEEKDNLFNQINSIEDKVESEVWESINLIRKIGNIAAHMKGDVNMIVDVEADEAGHLIELIEQLFEEWYVAREKRKDRMQKSKIMAEKKSLEVKAAAKAKTADSPARPEPPQDVYIKESRIPDKPQR